MVTQYADSSHLRAVLWSGVGMGKVHSGKRQEDLEALLRCRECRCRKANPLPEFASKISSEG